MIAVSITSESRYKFDRKMVREVVNTTLMAHGVTGDVEVGVGMVGERKMKLLHKKYMETEETTDVLSFPIGDRYPDGRLIMGDIVVCYPVAVKQAMENNRRVDEEIAFLVEHSCLHLLGIHHE